MRTRPGGNEQEVNFRVVSCARGDGPGAPVSPYREQTVDIAFGLQQSFQSTNFSNWRRFRMSALCLSKRTMSSFSSSFADR